MKAEQIKEAALKYFTIYGYEGASLARIAEDVGIKKQSIYAHFKGKDDLFLEVVREVKLLEWEAKRRHFDSVEPRHLRNRLYEFLKMHKQMFEEDERFRFWLRISFFPPPHLYKDVEKEVLEIEQAVEAMLREVFQKAIELEAVSGSDPAVPTLAYLGILDAIAMEIVYEGGSNRVEQKLEASWHVFWRGIAV
ncbi:TetR/AcrR family transcriptional regulator [Shouchella shacheensis]|uniref:TetR/AcrR family transcriptional regulator n=1 Tax=Shouchella shacheensis TaxID=1649580 RepID=UPI00073FD151|nr:TetR/AcrR family transcriptional regulator [Shouchella shacheensis]